MTQQRKKAFTRVGFYKTALSKKRHLLFAILLWWEGMTEQTMRRCSCPSPSTGLDWRILGGPGTRGTWNSWQVLQAELLWMRGQAPRGRGKVQGCAFLGVRPRRPRQGLGVRTVLGSLPVTAGALCSTRGGQGAGSLPGGLREGVQPAGQSKAPMSLLKASGSPVLCRDCTWTLSSTGRTGMGHWEQALVLQHQGRRQHSPKHLCSEVLGRNDVHGGQTLVLVTAGQAEMHGQPVRLCHESWGAREWAVPGQAGWAHSGLGPQGFCAP